MNFTTVVDEKDPRYRQVDFLPDYYDPRKFMPWLDQPRPCKITVSDHVILEDEAEEV